MQIEKNNRPHQHFCAKFIAPDKFMALSEEFVKKTKSYPKLTLKLVNENPNGADKFWLLDENNFVISSGKADFTNLNLSQEKATKKLVNIFYILNKKYILDKKIQSLLLEFHSSRDRILKKLMKDNNVTRNGSFDKGICE